MNSNIIYIKQLLLSKQALPPSRLPVGRQRLRQTILVARVIERRISDVVDNVRGGEQEWRVVHRGMDRRPVPLVHPPPDDGRSAMSSSAVVARGRMYSAEAMPPPP
jgi:hypothetical protein